MSDSSLDNLIIEGDCANVVTGLVGKMILLGG